MKNWNAKEGNEKQTSKALTHNLIIVDESGSMGYIYREALTGMNETLQSIKKSDEKSPQVVTLVTFDTGHYNEIFSEVPAAETRQLTENDYRPQGCTPLYDAMGRAITTLKGQVKEGERVLVTVITDGLENASTEYTAKDIEKLVKDLEEEEWIFAYIGANQDAVMEAQKMGIRDAMNFQATPEGASQMWSDYNACRESFAQMDDGESVKQKRGNFFKNMF